MVSHAETGSDPPIRSERESGCEINRRVNPTSRHRGKPLVGKPDLTTVGIIYNLSDGTNLTTS